MASYSSGGVVVAATDPLTAGALAATIGSITSVNIPQNVEAVPDDSGSIYDEGMAVTTHMPVAQVTTKSIAELLDVVGVAGQCFIIGVGSGVSVFGKNRGDCLNDVNATDHTRYRFRNGLLRLGTLTAARGSDATISFTVDGITDGTNAPMDIDHDQALPATLVKEQFEIGICKVGNVQFRPESVSIDFGQQEQKPKSLAPVVWPERIAVRKVQPVVTLTGIDPQIIGSAGINTYGSATHANTTIQLVKRLSGGTYVASASLLHVVFTIAGLVIVDDPFSASGQDDATTSLRIRAIHDGTNVPILYDTTSAFTVSP